MDIVSVLEVINREPQKFLYADTKKGIDVDVGGVSCTVARDRLRGGVVVFHDKGSFRLVWDRQQERWQAA